MDNEKITYFTFLNPFDFDMQHFSLRQWHMAIEFDIDRRLTTLAKSLCQFVFRSYFV